MLLGKRLSAEDRLTLTNFKARDQKSCIVPLRRIDNGATPLGDFDSRTGLRRATCDDLRAVPVTGRQERGKEESRENQRCNAKQGASRKRGQPPWPPKTQPEFRYVAYRPQTRCLHM